MPLKVAVQMDHISTISIAGDTTFALSLEAERRGHKLFHYTPDRLAQLGGKVFARVEELSVRDEKGNHFSLGEPVRTDLQEMDVILLRQDPPFDMNYITTTHILERIHPKTLVVNDPAWVRNSPEKIFVTEFPDLMPETLVTKDVREIAAFRKEHGDIIIKPLYGNGGAGIFHLQEADRNLAALLEMFEPDVSRALHRAALPEGCAQGRQAHHPDRRRAGRRRQPRAVRDGFALQHACRRPPGKDRAHRSASARSARASARRSRSAASSWSAST